MKVFSIFGVSDSGKTTTVEFIIAELIRRDFSVGSIKDIHFQDFNMDQEGTDTWRHKEAGAQLVTARGLHETDILFKGRLSLKRLLDIYDQDFVVLEGANNFFGPGIISAHNEHEIDIRMRHNIFALVGKVSRELGEYKGIPVLDGREDIVKLVDLIEENVPEWTGQKEWIEIE
jgi:molybdopterin-guanine dinucleotide biosynthesis protein B